MSEKTIVRRLTPIECERLQAFPDGWTDIGEWTDSKGKKHKEADTPRYKALGNSIATPFWFYLLRRISAQYERPATLGSLFDGIGGFPYCWERCNGAGTAVWASEIEEFPIAVTKKRFRDESATPKKWIIDRRWGTECPNCGFAMFELVGHTYTMAQTTYCPHCGEKLEKVEK